MGSNIVCVAKQVKVVHGAQALWYQTVWCVTVGAGFCFGAAKRQTLKEAGQKARRVRVDRMHKAATRKGLSGILEEWTIFAKKEGKEIFDRMGCGKGQCATEHLPSELVPA